MKRPLPLLLVLLPLLWGGACSLENSRKPAPDPSPQEPEVPFVGEPRAISMTVAWSAPGGGDGNQDMTLDNGVIYWADNIAETLSATDAATGRLLWVTRVGPTGTNPLVTPRGVWVQSDWVWGQPNKIFLVDKVTGALLTTITLPSDGYRTRHFTWTTMGRSLLWHAAEVGLVSLDEDSVAATAEQALTPTIQWPGRYHAISIPLYHNGKLYFQLRTLFDWMVPKSDGDDIIVLDPVTKTVVKRLVTDYATGNMHETMYLYQNRILYQDWNAIRAIDPATDSLIFGLQRNIDHSSGKGFAFAGDHLFFSSSSGQNPNPLYDKNLTCRSIVDGHLVWHVNADKYSLGSRPVYKNRLLYVNTQTALKVISADTGAIAGYDTSIQATEIDIVDNTLDDGTYLYPRANGKIWAIKMDWKIGVDGRLTR